MTGVLFGDDRKPALAHGGTHPGGAAIGPVQECGLARLGVCAPGEKRLRIGIACKDARDQVADFVGAIGCGQAAPFRGHQHRLLHRPHIANGRFQEQISAFARSAFREQFVAAPPLHHGAIAVARQEHDEDGYAERQPVGQMSAPH